MPHRARLRCAATCVRADWSGPAALDNGLVIEIEPGRFEDMVVTALDGLPVELGQTMRNVAVTVEHDPGPPGLLGLYEGIPLTSRTSQYAGVLPDRITIYQQAICAICRSEHEVADQVRRTVIHEIAHHSNGSARPPARSRCVTTLAAPSERTADLCSIPSCGCRGSRRTDHVHMRATPHDRSGPTSMCSGERSCSPGLLDRR
jgi:predicted Zn-dependent protease with MMP-like domain